jgi:signal transduction histidine kinase
MNKIEAIKTERDGLAGKEMIAHYTTTGWESIPVPQTEKLQSMQLEVSLILAESSSLTKAAPLLLKAICNTVGWELGAIWLVDHTAKVLRCDTMWHLPSIDAREFVTLSREMEFRSGTGLPGRVWASGESAWVTDVVNDTNFPRAPIALKVGLHGAFCFPIRIWSDIFGVIEFFSREIREPNRKLLDMMTDIGIKIGNFIERKRREEEKEALVSELTRALALAETARILGDVGHDAKNMLQPVVVASEILQEELDKLFERLPAPAQNEAKTSRALCNEVLEMLRDSSSRIQDRMKQIADCVKGQSSPPQFAPCQVADVVNYVMKILGMAAKEKGVALRTEGLEALPTILADDNRLFNAIYNLVDNAIPEVSAGGSIAIRGHAEPEAEVVHLEVADTGRGMPREVRERLFTARAISRKAGGTGLGTKIVKDVVDAHGGQITIESEVGVGTTFHIRLPFNPGARSI